MKIRGRILDWQNRCFVNVELSIEEGVILSIDLIDSFCDRFILPGLIDSHVHVESSMLMPSRFAEVAVGHGTVAVVADPHEIANVMGIRGVDLLVADSVLVPVKFFFGAPSCVPATLMEPSGADLNFGDVDVLLQRNNIWFLSEMMDYPSVIARREDSMLKIQSSRNLGKPIDGHAPGLTGIFADPYFGAGISTDHECSSVSEALDKISRGVMIQIREGSAARNFESLYSLITTHPRQVMLCTDDSHPDHFCRNGHIDRLVRLALARGCSIFDVMMAASVNPVLHYNIPVGLLRVGDKADFIVVDDIDRFQISQTYINGQLVYNEGTVLFKVPELQCENNFIADCIVVDDISVNTPSGSSFLKVIDVFDGELTTGKYLHPLSDDRLLLNLAPFDILKIVVLDRYRKRSPSVGFIRGFGLKRGAIAGSVAHDNHHIIAVGCSDADIVTAINLIVRQKGGIVWVDGEFSDVLPLPIGGIISDLRGEEVASRYESMDRAAKELGSHLMSPFMTLSFMSLLVIPELKIGAKGLFDVTKFEFTSLFE